jgi:hypothetical protein
MRVSLVSSGGFAAALALGRPPLVVDGAGLPAAEAAELAGLVAAAGTEEAPPDDGRARDAVSHRITVEDGGRTTVLRRTDATMSPAYARLLEWLREHASPAAPG